MCDLQYTNHEKTYKYMKKIQKNLPIIINRQNSITILWKENLLIFGFEDFQKILLVCFLP